MAKQIKRIIINLMPLVIFVLVTIGLIYLAAASVGGPHSEVVSFTLKPMPSDPAAPAQQSHEHSNGMSI